MRKFLLLMLGFVFFAYQIQAQTRTLSGKITDENGNPVPNASILIKGTRTGTTSNAEGKYSLSVPSQARVLVFSSINSGQIEAIIGNQTTIPAKGNVQAVDPTSSLYVWPIPDSELLYNSLVIQN